MEPSQKSSNNETEVSIKNLLELAWKSRRVISSVTLLFMLVIGIVSSAFMDKRYEANTILLISNAISKPTSIGDVSSGVEGLVDTLSVNYPQTIATYKEQILTSDMLNRVIEKLELQESYDVNKLASCITVTNIKDTNLLSVGVSTTDPYLSADIANTIAKEFSDFIAEMNSQRLAKSSEFLQEKVLEERKKLDVALDEYKTFLSLSPGTSEVFSEIESKSERLSVLKSELDALELNYLTEEMNTQNEIDRKLAALENINLILNDTEQFIVKNQSVLYDSLASDVIISSGMSVSEVAGLKLEDEVVNPNYIELMSKKNADTIELESLYQVLKNIKRTYTETKVILDNDIETLTTEIEALRVVYADKYNSEKLIVKNVDRAESSYDLFVQSYEESRVAESADIGKSTILINSVANPDLEPVSFSIIIITALAAIIGLVVSFIGVIFKFYWINTN